MKALSNFNQSDLYLLCTRCWLGLTMIKGGQSVLRFFSSQELRDFFQQWFGDELGFPAPLLMAFVAKGIEFFCGILICAGLFTRVSAALIAGVMLVATIAANLNFHGGVTGPFIRPDGFVTISSFLFAWLLIFVGPGKYSLTNLYKIFSGKRVPQ